MNKAETLLVTVAIIAGTVASILGSLTPALSGLLGTAIGYAAKGAINELPEVRATKKDTWKPGP